MKAMKKTLAILLCLTMCLSMMPTWALAEAPETDAALISVEPTAEVMQEPIPEEVTPDTPPQEPSEEVPEEAVLQEEIPEPEEQVNEEPEPENETYSEAEAVSDEGSGEEGTTGNDTSPVEESSEVQPNTVTNPEKAGEALAESSESPTEPESAADPAAENPDAAEAVTIIFRITPENAVPAVYTKENPENPEEKTEIEPEEDGSYLLLPGTYYYALTAEGYVTVEEETLLVVPSEEPVKVEAVMTPADEELSEEVTEEAMLQAEARPEETANLMANSGTCGDNLTWTLDDTGTLTIRGTGPMTDYSVSAEPRVSELAAPWIDNCFNIKKIMINNGVTSIGFGAFTHCSNLISVTIPGSVTSIGEYTFSGCSSLTSITIPGSVTSIGDYTFSRCSSLTGINIPEGVTSIGSSAFSWCSSLTSITIPDGVVGIESNTFYNCSSLTSVTIPETLNDVANDAFSNCNNITDVYYGATEAKRMKVLPHVLSDATWHYAEIEDNWDYCGDSLFWRYDSTMRTLHIKGEGAMWDYWSGDVPWAEYSGKLVKVEMEPGITAIGNYAFSNLTKLGSIMIPESVTGIGNHAFSGCTAVKSIVIPDSVEEILANAFTDCTNLTNADLSSSLTVIDYELFRNCSSLQRIELPDQLTTIRDNAFSGCTALTQIAIPETVTKIGAYAFNSCYKLTDVVLPAGLTTISNGMFQGCDGLSSVILPEGIKSIGEYAFAWSDGPASITIPEKIETIGKGAFHWCDGLKSISFPSNPPDISGDAFEGVTANAYYPADGNWWEEDRLNYGGALTWIAVSSSSVHYDLMGGKGNIPDQQKTYGVPLTLSLLIPTKENGTFLGWAETPNATKASYQPGASFGGEGTVTLYAVWEQIIEINAKNFPDANFRNYVADSYDLSRDGKLTKEEISWVRGMNCESRGIRTLKGIEFFSDLQNLNCRDNELTELDMSQNLELISLVCGSNDYSGNVLGNKLTNLNVSQNTKLQSLHIAYNQFTTLDLSNNPELESLWVYSNKLTALDVRDNPKLTELICDHNRLTVLDVTNNIALKTLRCSNNQLKSLDVSTCAELTGVNCSVNLLENLSLTNNTKLQWLAAYSNKLTTLDLRNCPQLTNIVRNSARKEYNNHTVVEYNLGDGSAFVNFDMGVTVQPTIFSDNGNPDAYYHDPIYWAVDHGITTGRSDTTFDPYGQCTRGHIVTFLWRAFGEQEPTVNNPFEDVHEGDSFYKAVLWAYENGITTGQTATTFGPWKSCTRGQIVTFLWRAMGETEPSIGNPFTDVNPGNGFYRAVLWAVENGITTGRTPTTFDPWATCTRGQAVTFLYRAMN